MRFFVNRCNLAIRALVNIALVTNDFSVPRALSTCSLLILAARINIFSYGSAVPIDKVDHAKFECL